MKTGPGLFDSLSHPTLSGRWLADGVDATVESLIADMNLAGFTRACAIGLPGVGEYDHVRFFELCRRYPQLVPVAGLDPTVRALEEELDRIESIGYRAVKVHPRISGFSFYDDAFVRVLEGTARRNIALFACTYVHAPRGRYPERDPFYGLAAALNAVPDARIVLVHGGDVDVMRYAQLVRHASNALLDLSFTMVKYAGSSIDLDLRFLLKHLDRKICIGVDYPEFHHEQVRRRFEELTAGLGNTERENAGSVNLASLLGVEL